MNAITYLFNSFKYAFQGMGAAFRTETKIKLHSLAALVVLVACYVFHFSAAEWMVSIFCITLVLAAELFNTAIEALCNVVSIDYKEGIKRAKDIAAAAVVCCVFGAVAVWLILLYRHFS